MSILDWLSSRAYKLAGAVFFSSLLASCSFISNRILAKPVVRVDVYQLSAQEFSRELADKLKSFDALSAKDPKIVNYFKQQIVNEFVVASLVELWFQESKLSLSHEEIDGEIRSIISTYPSDSEFRELLSESGQSYTEWAAKVEATLKKRKLLRELSKDAPKLDENELISYYNSNKLKYEQTEAALLSHILVDDLSQADVAKKLLAKQGFGEVAKKYSKAYNLESKESYGWVERSYAGELEKAFKVKTNEVFGPITMPDGVHIFKLIERRPHKSKTFAEVRSQIASEVVSLRETGKFSSWLDVQLKKYPVKKNISVIDSIRVETR